ncbi:MAG: RNA polymerase sigma factor [Bacteroidales bacterium]|nr:RNA polymerase sigma factor [Bacteroidales bacterium]
MQPQNLKDLIHQCRHNNEQAFRELTEMHQAMVFSLAFRIVCNEEEARDIVQETFIRVWKNINRYKPEMKFTTWLFTIAARLCYDKLKSSHRKSVQPLNSIKLINDFESLDNIEASVINSDLAAIITILTDKLTPKQKLVFTLRDIEGLEVNEVETITGMPAAKIKSNLYLARQFIKQQLEKM